MGVKLVADKERRAIEKYVLEVFHYEHDLATTILARLLLVCELLIKKGFLTEEELMDTLSDKNIALMMKELNYGDDEWDERKVGV